MPLGVDGTVHTLKSTAAASRDGSLLPAVPYTNTAATVWISLPKIERLKMTIPSQMGQRCGHRKTTIFLKHLLLAEMGTDVRAHSRALQRRSRCMHKPEQFCFSAAGEGIGDLRLFLHLWIRFAIAVESFSFRRGTPHHRRRCRFTPATGAQFGPARRRRNRVHPR